MRHGQFTISALTFATAFCQAGLALAQGEPAAPAAPAAPASEAAAPAAPAAPASEAAAPAAPAAPASEAAAPAAPAAPASEAAAPAAPAAPASEAAAEEKPAEGEAAAEGEAEEEGLGLSFALGYSSLYNWRGDNLFRGEGDSLNTQNGMINPAISYTTGELTIAYWGAFQINGDNIGEKTDVGLGKEQDLVFTVEHAVTDEFTVTPQMAFYYYPFADAEAAGTRFPVYFEPSLTFAYATVVDLKFMGSWYAGLQNALSDYRYVYLNPGVGKSLEVSDMVGVDLALAYGYKIYTSDLDQTENLHDINFTAGVPLALVDGLTVTPSFTFVWSDWDADGSVMTYGTLNVGYEL